MYLRNFYNYAKTKHNENAGKACTDQDLRYHLVCKLSFRSHNDIKLCQNILVKI